MQNRIIRLVFVAARKLIFDSYCIEEEMQQKFGESAFWIYELLRFVPFVVMPFQLLIYLQ